MPSVKPSWAVDYCLSRPASVWCISSIPEGPPLDRLSPHEISSSLRAGLTPPALTTQQVQHMLSAVTYAGPSPCLCSCLNPQAPRYHCWGIVLWNQPIMSLCISLLGLSQQGDYRLGDLSNRSLLSTILEAGVQDQGVITGGFLQRPFLLAYRWVSTFDIFT